LQSVRNILPVIFILILLCNSNTSWNYSGYDLESVHDSGATARTIAEESHNYTQSDSIEVIGDDSFTENGFSGNGTWQSPYLLENKNITTETTTAIRIINTTRPFVVRSCFIVTQMDDLDFGVYFENVTNGILDGSHVSGLFTRAGLYFRYCRNIQVNESLLTNCHSAIVTWGVWNLTVFNNRIIDSRFYAGLLDMIHDSTITNNTLIGNKIGFGISGSSNVFVESNTIANGSGGVHYGETWNLVVCNNYFANLNASAVFSTSMIQGYSSPNEASFEFRIRNTIADNEFNNCSMAFYSDIGYYTQFSNNSVNNCIIGIFLTWSAGNYIIDNTISGSVEYGIHCLDAHLNRIYGNLVISSGLYNALDDEGYNYWDDDYSIGNTWDDYIGPGGYCIPGDSNSVDHWPARFGPPYISIANETQIIVGSVDANITWRAFDSDPSSFTIYQNGTVISTGVWDGNNLVVHFDGLEVGVYNLTAMVVDELGCVASAAIFVNVLPIPVILYLGIISGVSILLVLIILASQKRKITT